jgi:TonB family protein
MAFSLMGVPRSLVRSWRRLRRPTLGRLIVASIALHVLAGLGIVAWLTRESSQAPPPSRAPLIVELPPAEPGQPLVRPEATRPPAARPAPAPRTPAPAPPSVAKPPAPVPPPPAPVSPPPPPAPSPPPAVARAPEPAAPPPPEPVPAPPAPAPAPVEPSPPAVAARPPEAGAGSAGPARPSVPEAPAESPFAGRQFSLLTPKLEVPSLPEPSGRGGSQSHGAGAGESGVDTEGQIAVPLDTPDPRYADYFAELKRRIEDKWTYPEEAARKGQSGRGELRFVLRKDGSVRTVEIVSSSGVRILDSYIQNAIRMAQPFPPIPTSVADDVLPISINFRYVLGGVRAFGFR